MNFLQFYHTMPHFDALTIYSCGKHSEKRRNCLQRAISLFLTMFSTLYGTYFPFQMLFKMPSAICFNLNQSKILSSGNGLKHILFFPVIGKKYPSLPPQSLKHNTHHSTTLDDQEPGFFGLCDLYGIWSNLKYKHTHTKIISCL